MFRLLKNGVKSDEVRDEVRFVAGLMGPWRVCAGERETRSVWKSAEVCSAVNYAV